MIRWIGYLIVSVSLFANEPDFGKFDGTGVILDLNSSERIVFGTRADERLTPCSTFKILNSMIALDHKVVRDENETLAWDGVIREYPVWNRDHSMRSAITVSAVWFYQEMAQRIGKTRMQEMVLRVNYGNTDTSDTLTDFWLSNGSLKISANEQVDFIAKLIQNDVPFSPRSISTIKDIMTLDKKQDYTFAGKTGSCGEVGWFVGYLEENNTKKVFAFNIKGKNASGAEAKRILLEYLQ